ncbi:prepilin peptidase [Leifsonia shinshuensis]|uniref:prepilin peptidase n=1 Tax=Leifsonia shinshuensis TaxID=150026 RepID=UPI001F50DA0F|nr:prepilin peptidase [Leifsonia shinshuensis]MCI0156074.1 prepilin peptidase [Leifsonia shinshuensis]
MGETPIRIALAAGLGVALLGARDAGPAAVGTLYVAAVTAALVQYDLRERRLPDALVLPGVAFVGVGAVWSALSGGGPIVMVAAALGGLGVLAVFLVLASGGGLGMGDVKLAAVLAAALAALVTERAPPEAEPAAAVLGAVCSLVVGSLVLGALAAGIVVRSRGAGRGAGAAGAGRAEGTARGKGAHRPAIADDLPFGPVLLAVFWAVALGW